MKFPADSHTATAPAPQIQPGRLPLNHSMAAGIGALYGGLILYAATMGATHLSHIAISIAVIAVVPICWLARSMACRRFHRHRRGTYTAIQAHDHEDRTNDPRAISSKLGDLANCSQAQLRLMDLLTTLNLNDAEQFDKIVVEALDARDLGHFIEAESLFQEAIRFAEIRLGGDSFLLMLVFLHFAYFLKVQGRTQESEAAYARYTVLNGLYV